MIKFHNSLFALTLHLPSTQTLPSPVVALPLVFGGFCTFVHGVPSIAYSRSRAKYFWFTGRQLSSHSASSGQDRQRENQEIEKLSHSTEQLLCVQWFNPPFTYGSHLYFCPRNDWLSNSRHCSARKSPSLFGHSWKMRAEWSTLWDEWHPINYRQKLKLQFSMLIFHFVRVNTTKLHLMHHCVLIQHSPSFDRCGTF